MGTQMQIRGGSGSGDTSGSIGFSISGKPTASQVIMIPIAGGVTYTIPENMVGSKGKASVSATGQTDFDVQKNGVSVATIRFGAGQTVPTFICAAEVELVGDDGDYLKIICPASVDGTLADIGISIKVSK
jgi:hypothetical protein